MGCLKSCAKCLSLVPWASLISMIICWTGTALFCGTGHEALTLSFNLLRSFPNSSQYNSELEQINQVFTGIKYFIYAVAGFMFVLSVFLLIDGILATKAVQSEIDFTCRTSKCGICSGIMYTALTYIVSVAWILISAFCALPIHFFQVSNTQCELTKTNNNNGDICIDFVQAGLLPYNDSKQGKLCGEDLKNVCNQPEYEMVYDMYLIAFAGAVIVVLSLKHYLMTLSANFAYIKMTCKLADYQDTKYREEMELNDIINTARSNERLTYKY